MQILHSTFGYVQDDTMLDSDDTRLMVRAGSHPTLRDAQDGAPGGVVEQQIFSLRSGRDDEAGELRYSTLHLRRMGHPVLVQGMKDSSK